MVATINTIAFQGVDVQPVDVQVQISSGLPAFNIVGLPDKAVAESKERVRAALHAVVKRHGQAKIFPSLHRKIYCN